MYCDGGCADGHYDTGMGLSLANVAKGVDAVTSPVSTIFSAVSSIFGGGNAKDAERIAKNTNWFNECSSGDADACCALKYMSGRFGAAKCGRYGDAAGFATSKAKDDAFAKYNALPSNAPSQAYPPLTGAQATPQMLPELTAMAKSSSLPLLLGIGLLGLVLSGRR